MAINCDLYLGFDSIKRYTTKYFVWEKIELLYDMCILRLRTGWQPDPLEEAVREILTRCKTERRMTNALHDVIFNDKPIKEFVAERGGVSR
jgi:hypothetical protein